MPHVSKKKLSDAALKKLFKQFAELHTHLDSRASRAFLTSLLTETEQVMLTKRFASVIMLHEGYSRYAVEKTLNLSSSTVARIAHSAENGEYDPLIRIFNRKKEEKEKFWATLEVLLRGKMPSMGKERRKHT